MSFGSLGEPPVRLGTDAASTYTGIYAAQAALAALWRRCRTARASASMSRSSAACWRCASPSGRRSPTRMSGTASTTTATSARRRPATSARTAPSPWSSAASTTSSGRRSPPSSASTSFTGGAADRPPGGRLELATGSHLQAALGALPQELHRRRGRRHPQQARRQRLPSQHLPGRLRPSADHPPRHPTGEEQPQPRPRHGDEAAVGVLRHAGRVHLPPPAHGQHTAEVLAELGIKARP